MSSGTWTVVFFLLWFVRTAEAQFVPLSPRLANYQLDVQLDTDTKYLTGKETLVWTNPSNEVIHELQFHLYLNAFRNGQSTFMRESGGQLRGAFIKRNDEASYGWIDILSMQARQASGKTEVLTGKYQFIQPDDANADDRTVISVPLSQPLGPGQRITIDMAFRARLPRIFARTGYSDDFFLVAQWFPKIGVYEPPGTRYVASPGRWNCHQFHANSEFYADYGVYDVTVTVPQNFRVGATGLLKSERQNANGTKTMRWRAEDVVDFAWTASTAFTVFDDRWRHVAIRVLMQPEHASQAQRHIDAAKVALAYFDKHLGRYPFTTLTIVDPPMSGLGAGGMEYPTFITAGTSWGLPAGVRVPEQVVIHEFGHQYFMQLLATNEFEEAWLDEGFNQYYEGRIMDETYGPKSSLTDLFGYRVGNLEVSRNSYVHLDHPAIAPSFGNVWQLPDAYYGELTYFKPATWMRTLDGLVGRPVMDEIMRTYFNRWKFKHPNAKNFIAIVNEVVAKRLGSRLGPNLNWFFDQVLYGTQVCDYELHAVRSVRQGNAYRSAITVYRRGDAQLPVEVLVHFEDGSEKLLHWNGKASAHTFTLTQPSQAEWAKVDPQQKIYMDINLNNNSFAIRPPASPAAKYAAKLMFWAQNWMQWLAWLV
ncbi:peptidase M1-like protein [Larkinella arboricola]|uniref:Peptidase M1-like protein n=1 Tax=Larkinella arboricola TaxID=643671 RepID=A0A327X5S2_LARAB|nr:M1 family metallopeptidase [Larkinella arboricola]RAK02009.1 peptidase M1-like protein [Larkinella arboricola]